MNILFAVKEIDLEHLGIMHLSSFLKDKGYNVEVVAADYKEIRKKIEVKNFEIIAYSVPTLLLDFYLSLNNKLKEEFNIFSIFGGPHPTLVPEIIYHNNIDCVCRGEGELAMLELADKMSRKESIFDIENMWLKQNGDIFKNPLRPPIQDLDRLPFPDRALFSNTGVSDQGKIHVITSRGCLYECSYCAQPAYNRLYRNRSMVVRRRSPGNVIDEIKEIKKTIHLKFIKFEDDLFISSSQWIDEFCDLYEKEVNVPFFCYVRAEIVNNKIIKRLKKSGCRTISMGIETADNYLRTAILKRSVSKEAIVKAAHIIKEEGLILEGLNMVGIPKGSLESDIETLELNIQCNVDYANTKLFMPYPGTDIYSFVSSRGLLSDFPFLSFWESSLRFKTLKEKRRVENLQKLFSLSVEFPFFLPLVKKIIEFPLGKLYIFLNLVWDGYVSFSRIYPIGLKDILRRLAKYIGTFCDAAFYDFGTKNND